MRTFAAFLGSAALAWSCATVTAPVRAEGPAIRWLLSQRAQTCFPWFLAGIGSTNVAFDARNLNKGTGSDAILDAGFLAAGTLVSIGDDRLRIVYDDAHRVALFDHTFASGTEEYVLSGVGPPPVTIERSNLGGLETQRGLRLGASFAQVTRHDGPSPRAVLRCGLQAVVYQIPGRDCTSERDFIFKDRRLIAFGYGGDC